MTTMPPNVTRTWSAPPVIAKTDHMIELRGVVKIVDRAAAPESEAPKS